MLKIRSAQITCLAAILGLTLMGCSRESTPDAATTAAQEIPVAEPPPVEEPYAVEAPAGEESTQTNPATAPAPTDTAPAEPAKPAADAPDRSSIKATNFKAYGNEPFWNAQIDGNAVLYATLENQEGVMLTAQRSGDGNKVIYSGENAGKPFSFTFVKRRCLDSMSGRPFGYWVSATIDGRTETGCADAK